MTRIWHYLLRRIRYPEADRYLHFMVETFPKVEK